MTTKEVKKIIKSEFVQLGFKNNGNAYYKMIDEEYLVGLFLDHHPFRNAYFVECGGVYLPDAKKIPFKGWFDYSTSFRFYVKSEGREKFTDYLEYEFKSEKEVIEEINENVNEILNLYYDKFYIINQLKSDINKIKKCSFQDLDKLIARAELDKRIVYNTFYSQPNLNDLDKYLKKTQ